MPRLISFTFTPKTTSSIQLCDTVVSASCQASVDGSFPCVNSFLSFLNISVFISTKIRRYPSPHREPVRSPWLHSAGAQHPEQPAGTSSNGISTVTEPSLATSSSIPCPCPCCIPVYHCLGWAPYRALKCKATAAHLKRAGVHRVPAAPAVTWHENTHFKEIFHTLRMFSEHQLSNPTACDSGQLAEPEGCFVP